MLSAQARFEAILPRLRLIIAKYFRSYYNQDDKDDAIAEAIALSWRRFRALIQRGIDPNNLGYSIGSRAALQVHRGARWTVTNQKRGRHCGPGHHRYPLQRLSTANHCWP
jgi:hypothetical protein